MSNEAWKVFVQALAGMAVDDNKFHLDQVTPMKSMKATIMSSLLVRVEIQTLSLVMCPMILYREERNIVEGTLSNNTPKLGYHIGLESHYDVEGNSLAQTYYTMTSNYQYVEGFDNNNIDVWKVLVQVMAGMVVDGNKFHLHQVTSMKSMEATVMSSLLVRVEFQFLFNGNVSNEPVQRREAEWKDLGYRFCNEKLIAEDHKQMHVYDALKLEKKKKYGRF
ncbi:unnamed protein product [Lupinus luteus]|uniref:Uncharacterized protein n=1 Tax=Lupinus luteus TaxID=3873 RepID=A0AAV1VXZ3_LUPLU